MALERHEVLVVGGGPAGLAASRELRQRGLDHVVLEAGPLVGSSWRRYYDSLVLHTGKHLSSMPGLPFRRSDPMFVPRDRFVTYLEQYARDLDLPVRTDAEVSRLARTDGAWHATTGARELRAGVAIVATGIATHPVRPRVRGLEAFGGRVLHSIDYRRPSDLAGCRVLVVGAGNSGAEIAAELGLAGIPVAISIRSGVVVVARDILGVPTQYLGRIVRVLPRPIVAGIVRLLAALRERRRGPSPLPRGTANPFEQIPLIGFHLPDAVEAGRVVLRGAIATVGPDGATFADGSAERFDAVILATGFRPALAFLDQRVRLDEHGFAVRSGRVASADLPGLFFVGHNYDATGGLANIRRDAPLAAEAAAKVVAAARGR